MSSERKKHSNLPFRSLAMLGDAIDKATLQPVEPTSGCTCKSLQRVFKDTALRCRRCMLHDAVGELQAECFQHFNSSQYKRAFEDCGVKVVSLAIFGGSGWWVPWWAWRVVMILHPTPRNASPLCGPLLKRAAHDEDLRSTLEATLRLLDPDDADGWFALERFAEAHGVTPLSLATGGI